MLNPRFVIAMLLGVLLIYTPGSTQAQTSPSTAQQPANTSAFTRGVELYKQGDNRGAIRTLRDAVKQNETDADAWHYLGLALNRSGDAKEARKAFQRAIKLRPGFALAYVGLAYTSLTTNKLGDADRAAKQALALDASNAEAYYVLGVTELQRGDHKDALDRAEAALKFKPGLAAAHFLKFQALLGLTVPTLFLDQSKKSKLPPPLDEAEQETQRSINQDRFRVAAKSLEQYLRLSPADVNGGYLREQLETIRFYAGDEGIPDSERTVFRTAELDTRLQIISKPEPGYTEKARQNKVEGTIVLRVLFAADGRVKYILVLKSLSHGLTETAIAAARAIRFQPGIKNGHPVSTVGQVNYTYNIY